MALKQFCNHERDSLESLTGEIQMKSHRVPFTLAGALPLLLAVSMPTGFAAKTLPSPTLDPQAIVQIHDLSHHNPESFSGVIADATGNVTVLVPVNADRAKIDRLLGSVDASVTRRIVERSLKDLLAIQGRINDSIISGSSPTLIGTAIDAEANRVVAYSTAAEDDSARLGSTFGETVAVQTGERAFTAAGRQSDSPPFYAGGRLSVGSRYCTSGFYVKIGTTTYMLTAGHCFALSASVKNGNGTYAVGTVKTREYGTSRLDVEFINGGSYSARTFVGGVTSTSSVPVSYFGYSCGFCNIFAGGSVTGQVLGQTISSDASIGACYTISGTLTCGLAQAYSSGTLCQAGDSGGPIYTTDGAGRATAIGLIQGYSADQHTCWYTILGRVLNKYGATLQTS